MPGYADVLIGVDIEAAVTNAKIVDCEYLEGEASGDEFLAAIELKAGCHDTIIEDNIFRAGWSSNPDDGISLKGASNNVTIRNNRLSGPYGDGEGVTAAISNSTGVCLDLLIENNIMKVKDGESGIEVIATTPAVIRHNTIISTGLAIDSMIVATIGELDQNVGITTDGTSGEIIGGGTVAPEIVAYNLDHLAKTADGSAAYPASVTTNSILGMIMSTDGDVSNFDKSTDSLQSIRDAVGLIESPTDVTGAISAAPTAKSLQDILHKDGNCDYSKTTDSLQAIRDYIAGITALDAINLDHLALTDTGVAADEDISGIVVAGSILGHIMSTDADPANFNASTDSLQSIADAVAALSWDAAVSQSPTPRSMQDILEKDNSGTFDDATDSLEAIRDHLDGTTILGGIQLDHLAKTASAGTNYPTEVTTDSFLGMIMSANGNPSGFNKTTDSLQAIRDHLDGTTVLGGIYLDHLSKTADGSANYPASMATNSQLAMIMASDGDPTGYNKTTDSLEAIRDHLDGATVLAGIQLDTLAGVDTTVAVDGDLEAHCVAGSLLAHILSATKDATTFKCSTDSLEAISVALAAGTGCSTALDGDLLHTLAGTTTGIAAGSDLEDSCVAGSLLTHVLSVGADVTTFDCRTDSLEALSNKIGAYTFDDGGDDEDTIMAHLDLIYTDSQAILGDTSVSDPLIAKSVTKTITNLSAASGATNIFTVSGGPVKVTSIVGVVANVIKNATINCKIQAQPTAPGNAVDVTNVVDIDTAAAGTTLTPGATFGAALVLTANGVIGDMGFDFVMDAGNIVMNLDANGDADDSIEWYIRYEPLVSGAAIAAAS